MISGFSGHGMQHAPGAGLALAEWILDGAPRTIDIRPLGYARIAQGAPLPELNVIG
jgi:glycine/D-amino acid oxidase-like deaminating enzyme